MRTAASISPRRRRPPGRPARKAIRHVLATVLCVLIGTSAAVAVPSPGYAATARLTIGQGLSSCPPGYLCLWTLNNFSGTGYAFFNSEANYVTLPAPFNGIQDYSWSFYNNGYAGSYEDVALFRDINYSGDRLTLCRGSSIAYLPANYTLPQSTAEPGRGWRDQVSSHQWGMWCS